MAGLIFVALIPLLLRTGSRADNLLLVDSGLLTDLLSSTSSVNCASPSITQHRNVLNFAAVITSPLPILLLVRFLPLLGSRILVRTSMLLLILRLWPILHPILVIIICMLVTVRVYLYHIGHTILRSLKHTFTLSNVLNIPHITKPLLSVQKFCRDNNVYFKFHASVFYVKDLTIQAVLLSGQSNDGLYVLSKSSATTIPQAYWSPCVSATADLRHRRLGHPMSRIFNLLVFKNKIMCTSRRSLVQCQACLLGKSSHMSLRPMGHKTTAPLDLIFSDVYKTYMVLSVYYQI